MISNLPIFREEKVYGGLMTYSRWEWQAIQEFDTMEDWRGHHYSGAFVHSEAVFFPRTLPFTGRYDHYGRLVPDRECLGRASTRIVTDQFEEDIVIRTRDKYQFWPTLEAPFSLDTLIDVACAGALHVKYNGAVVPVALWMVKASVYEMMRDIGKSKRGAGRWDMANHEKENLLEAVKNNWYEGDGDVMKLWRQLFELRDGFSMYREYFGHVTPNAGSFSHWMMKHKPDAAVVEEVLAEADDFMDFVHAMHLGRYAFLPVTGAGSQNDSMEVQKAVAEVVLAATDPYEE